MIANGTHLGKIADYALQLNGKGNPQIVIAFVIGADRITWYGQLAEGKSREITFKALLVCGWAGKTLADLSDGPASNALDMSKELSLVIDEEPDQAGKLHKKVRWINDPSSGAFKERLGKEDAIMKLKGMNIEQDFNFYKSAANYKPAEKKVEAAKTEFTNESIPF